MRRWFEFSRWNAVFLLLLMGVFGALFAWNTFGLLQMGMANAGFIRRFGWTALADGGLLQFIIIVGKGYASLLFYLGFKAGEAALMRRWFGPR